MNAIPGAFEEIDGGDAQATLDAAAQTRACEEGRAIALDLGAVRARMGDRWPARREGVWAHTQRAILRDGGRDVLYRRLDETRFLLAFPEHSGGAALNLGLSIMDGVLAHFLGRVSEADRVVRMITSVDGERVELAPPRASEARTFAASSALWTKIDGRAPKDALSLVADHAGLEVKIGAEEVFDLRAQAVLGRRIAVSVHDQRLDRVLVHQEIAALPTGPLLSIVNEVLDRVDALLASPSVPVIVVPVLLQVFANSRLRQATLERIHRQAKDHRNRLIFEIVGVDGGTPLARVQEALALLKPACRSAICRVQPTHSALGVVREAGARGIVINSQEIGGSGVRLSAGLMAFGSAAKAVAPLRMAAGLDHRSQLSICTLAGYTHASVATTVDD